MDTKKPASQKNSKNGPPKKKPEDIFRSPQIIRQPMNRSAIIGGRAVFQVSATGLPLPRYQWFHNGTAIPGAMGPRLVLPKIRQSDVGLYTCEAKNLAGSVSSKQVSLMIVQAQVPEISIVPAQLTCQVKDRVVFAIQLEDKEKIDSSKYDIQWFCNGRKIRGATKLVLDVKHAPEQLSGELVAKISLKVNPNAYRVSEPAKLTVHSGEPVATDLNPQAQATIAPEQKTSVKDTPCSSIPLIRKDFLSPNTQVPTEQNTEDEEESFFAFGSNPLPKRAKSLIALEARKEYLERTLSRIKNSHAKKNLFSRAQYLKRVLAKLQRHKSLQGKAKAS